MVRGLAILITITALVWSLWMSWEWLRNPNKRKNNK